MDRSHVGRAGTVARALEMLLTGPAAVVAAVAAGLLLGVLLGGCVWLIVRRRSRRRPRTEG